MIEPAYRYRATCDRVIDGDTYVLRIDLGFRAALTINGRLRGVNSPELNTPEGQAARDFVETVLRPGPVGVVQCVVESYKDRQSFARWIVDIWLPDGQPLADVLINAGYGVPA